MGNTTQDPLDYFFYVIVGIMVVVLAVRYILEKRRTQSESTDSNRAQGPASSFRFPTPRLNFIPIFHYKNQSDAEEEEEEEEEEEGECAVCLSAFEEGEELKRLSKCKHSFHAPCIDMWLNSHMDCPLCRSPVDLPPDSVLRPHSPEGLIRGPDLV